MSASGVQLDKLLPFDLAPCKNYISLSHLAVVDVTIALNGGSGAYDRILYCAAVH